MWVLESSFSSNIGKGDVTTNPLPISSNSTFKVQINLQEVEPTWNLAGYLNIASGNSEIILYSSQKILIGYENLVTTGFETGDAPRPDLIRLVFVPVPWVRRVEYDYLIYRFDV